MSKSAFLECVEREMRGAWVNYFVSMGATPERAEEVVAHLDETGKWPELIEALNKSDDVDGLMFGEVLEQLRKEYGHEGGMNDGSPLADLMRRVAERAGSTLTWEQWDKGER